MPTTKSKIRLITIPIIKKDRSDFFLCACFAADFGVMAVRALIPASRFVARSGLLELVSGVPANSLVTLTWERVSGAVRVTVRLSTAKTRTLGKNLGMDSILVVFKMLDRLVLVRACSDDADSFLPRKSVCSTTNDPRQPATGYHCSRSQRLPERQFRLTSYNG